MPRITRGWHDRCYLTDQQSDDLIYLLTSVIAEYKAANVTYWLTSGTLLGYYRTKDILRHDYDADLAVLYPYGGKYDEKQLIQSLTKKHISYLSCYNKNGDRIGVCVFKYKDVTLDIMMYISYEDHAHGKTRQMLRRFPIVEDGDKMTYIEMIDYSLQTFPMSMVVPLQYKSFLGMGVNIPNKLEDYLYFHYRTFKYEMPYKWKCWF
uniref:Fukutin-like n=1 Tax=Saccoglossus kowalevskii TaxID=10224 RepID=A0ABM0M892_SACKO|nr:PREDICTED: fukutin-like [Saccoglossus kowalevskii]